MRRFYLAGFTAPNNTIARINPETAMAPGVEYSGAGISQSEHGTSTSTGFSMACSFAYFSASRFFPLDLRSAMLDSTVFQFEAKASLTAVQSRQFRTASLYRFLITVDW